MFKLDNFAVFYLFCVNFCKSARCRALMFSWQISMIFFARFYSIAIVLADLHLASNILMQIVMSIFEFS